MESLRKDDPILRQSSNHVNAVKPVDLESRVKSDTVLGGFRRKVVSWGLALTLVTSALTPARVYADVPASVREDVESKIRRAEYLISQMDLLENKWNEFSEKYHVDESKIDARADEYISAGNAISPSSAWDYVDYITQDWPKDDAYKYGRSIMYKHIIYYLELLTIDQYVSAYVDSSDEHYSKIEEKLSSSSSLTVISRKAAATSSITSSVASVSETSQTSDATEQKSEDEKSSEQKTEPKKVHKKHKRRHRRRDHKHSQYKEVKVLLHLYDKVEKKIAEARKLSDKKAKEDSKNKDKYEDVNRKLSQISGDVADMKKKAVEDLKSTSDPKARREKLKKYADEIRDINRKLDKIIKLLKEGRPDAAKSAADDVSERTIGSALEEVRRLAGSLGDLKPPKDVVPQKFKAPEVVVEESKKELKVTPKSESEESNFYVGPYANASVGLMSPTSNESFGSSSIIIGGGIDIGSKRFGLSAGINAESYSMGSEEEDNVVSPPVDSGDALLEMGNVRGSVGVYYKDEDLKVRIKGESDGKGLVGGSVDVNSTGMYLTARYLHSLSENYGDSAEVRFVLARDWLMLASANVNWLPEEYHGSDKTVHPIGPISTLNFYTVLPVGEYLALDGAMTTLLNPEHYKAAGSVGVMARTGQGYLGGGVQMVCTDGDCGFGPRASAAYWGEKGVLAITGGTDLDGNLTMMVELTYKYK